MKISVIWVLFSVVGTALVFLNFSIKESSSSVSAMEFPRNGDDLTMTSTSRKLKDDDSISSTEKSGGEYLNLEDYIPIDPVPSSTTSIRPGPIQHGTPLMPFIPKPSPPDPPKNGGFP